MKTLKTSKAIVKLAILACLIFSLQLAQSAETGVDGDTLPLVDEALSKTDEALSGGEEALSEEAEPTLSLLLRRWCVDLMVLCRRFLQLC